MIEWPHSFLQNLESIVWRTRVSMIGEFTIALTGSSSLNASNGFVGRVPTARGLSGAFGLSREPSINDFLVRSSPLKISTTVPVKLLLMLPCSFVLRGNLWQLIPKEIIVPKSEVLSKYLNVRLTFRSSFNQCIQSCSMRGDPGVGCSCILEFIVLRLN